MDLLLPIESERHPIGWIGGLCKNTVCTPYQLNRGKGTLASIAGERPQTLPGGRMLRVFMSKGALKQLPLIVACYVLLQHHDGAYRQTAAAEAGNRNGKGHIAFA
jgi:hypothetical protein